MGLLDRFTSAFAGALPDYGAEVRAVQDDPADVPLAHSRAFPSAYTRGAASGSVEGRLLNAALSAVQNRVSQSRHLDGAEGSVARGLEQDADMRVLVLGETALTWWDFGMAGTDTPPTLRQRVDRSHVATIVDTGTRAQGGTQVTRVTFTDGSWFDYRLVQPDARFWAVAASYGPASAD